jgi:Ran-binding protein 1
VFLSLFAVMPSSKLQEHTGSDKAWVWSAVDYADGEHKVELFCIRFGSPESKWPELVG